MVEISYGRWEWAMGEHGRFLRGLIEDRSLVRICDVGGGATPTLPIEYIRQHNLDYTLLDISAEELAKAPAGYRKVVADISARELNVAAKFDLIFSKYVAEHVSDAVAFHRNVYKLLAPGGVAFHFFPTLYALPFVVNRVLPEPIGAALKRLFAPAGDKFRAYYNWCRGPSKRQIARLERLGYSVLVYKGFFGHSYYRRIPLAREIHELMTRYLVLHPVQVLTSYSYLVLKREGS